MIACEAAVGLLGSGAMTSNIPRTFFISCIIAVIPTAASAAQPSRNCSRAVGTWTVSSLGLPWNYDVRPDGTAVVDDWNRSTWTCKGNVYTFTNGFGARVTLTLSADGNRMSGTMTDGMPASAVRTSGPPVAARQASRERRTSSEPGLRQTATATSERGGGWKQFGGNTNPNPQGVVVVRCVDTQSLRSEANNIVSYRYTTQSRNARCGTGAQVKTERVDCSRLEMYRVPARIPGLADIMGPVAEANEYACSNVQSAKDGSGDNAENRTSDCDRLIAAMDRCIGSIPTEEFRSTVTKLRQATVDMARKGGAFAQRACKTDLPNWTNCLRH